MGGKKEEQALRRRIREGKVQRQDVIRRLAEVAFGRPNDCVRLVVEEDVDLESLDLCLLAEVRRSEKGMVEVKLVDRLKVLEQLAALMGKETDAVEGFFQSLKSGEEP